MMAKKNGRAVSSVSSEKESLHDFTTTEETTKMAEVRVKLTEVDGNRLELRLENTMISNANEGIYTVSPGKARGSPPVAAQLNSPMKKALDAAEAFERGQDPPLSPEQKEEERKAGEMAAFREKMKAFSMDEGEDVHVGETRVGRASREIEERAKEGPGRRIKPSILERMKAFE